MANLLKYFGNVTKSVVYMTAENVKELNPFIKDFAETNEQTTKFLYESIKDYKQSIPKVKKSITSSVYYKVADEFRKNLFDDLKTGKFYNKEREEEAFSGMMEEMGGGEGEDIGITFDDDFGDEGGSDVDFGDDGDVEVSIDDVGEKTSSAINVVTARSAEYTAEVSKANTGKIAGHIMKLGSDLTNGIGSMSSNLINLQNFNENVMKVHVDNSTKFFETMTTMIDAQNKMIQEMVDLQKRSAGATNVTQNTDEEKDAYSFISGEGALDIGGYFKFVVDNINKEIKSWTEMMDMTGTGSGIMGIASSPISLLLGGLVGSLIPKQLKNSMASLNKTLSGVAGSLFNKLKDFVSERFGDNILNFLGLGKELENSFSTGTYEHGPIPWDGESKKALTEVIPSYLSSIESAITGNAAKFFDYGSGTYRNMEQLSTAKENTFRQYAESNSYELLSQFNKFLNNFDMTQQEKTDQYNNFKNVLIEMIENGKELNEYLINYKGVKEDEENEDSDGEEKKKDEYDEDKDQRYQEYYDDITSLDNNMRELISLFFKTTPDNEKYKVTKFNSKQYKTKNQMNEYLHQLSKVGGGVLANTVNGFIDNTKTEEGVSGSLLAKLNRLNTIVDTNILEIQSIDYGFSIYDYMEEIVTLLRNTPSNSSESSNRTTSQSVQNIIRSTVRDFDVNNPYYMNYLNQLEQSSENSERQIPSPANRNRVGSSVPISSDSKDEAIDNENEDESYSEEDDEVRGEGGKLRFDRFLNMDEEDRAALIEELKIEQLEKINKATEETTGFFGDIRKGFHDLLKRPVDFIDNIIKKADQKIYELLFGKLDEHGRYNGMVELIIGQIKDTFKKFGDWLDRSFLGPLWNSIKTGPIGRFFSGLFGKDDDGDDNNNDDGGSGGEKSSDGSKPKKPKFQFGKFQESKEEQEDRLRDEEAAIHSFFSSNVEGYNADSDDAAKYDKTKKKWIYNGKEYEVKDGNIQEIKHLAFGSKFIPKTGLYTLSKGEMVIPREDNPYYNGPETSKEDQIKEEKKSIYDFFKNGGGEIPQFADGEGGESTTVNIPDEDNTSGWSSFVGKLNTLVDKIIGKVSDFKDEAKEGINEANEKSESLKKIKNSKEYKKSKEVGGKVGNVLNEGIDNLASGIEKFGETVFQSADGDTENFKKYLTSGQKFFKSIFKDAKQNPGSLIAGGGLGLLATMLTGIGGPLLGAFGGATIGLIKDSENLKSLLFGKEIDGERAHNGLLPPSISKAITKYLPSMATGGAIGGLVSLIPGVPLGPIAGLMLGSAVGFAKKNENFMDFIFGREITDENGKKVRKGGLIGDTGTMKEKLKKHLPNMSIGAIAGLLAGPFGLVGNLTLGAAVGYASSTNKFAELLLGKEVDDGNGKKHREGGLAGSIREHVINPLKEGFKPVTKQISLGIKGTFDHLKNFLEKMFEGYVGLPINRFLIEKIFKPVGKTIGGITKVFLKPAEFLLTAPFRAFGAIGSHYRKKHIATGNANYMSAEERLKYREEKGLGKFSGKDKFESFDTDLVNMTDEDLHSMANTFQLAKDAKKSVKIFERESRQKIMQKINGMDLDYDTASHLNKLIQNGEVEKAQKYLSKKQSSNDVDAATADELRNIMTSESEDLEVFKQQGTDVKANRKRLQQVMKEQYGMSLKDKDMDKMEALLDREISDREALEDPTEKAVREQTEEQKTRHLELMGYIRSISENLEILNEPDAVEKDEKLKAYKAKKDKRAKKAVSTKIGMFGSLGSRVVMTPDQIANYRLGHGSNGDYTLVDEFLNGTDSDGNPIYVTFELNNLSEDEPCSTGRTANDYAAAINNVLGVNITGHDIVVGLDPKQIKDLNNKLTLTNNVNNNLTMGKSIRNTFSKIRSHGIKGSIGIGVGKVKGKIRSKINDLGDSFKAKKQKIRNAGNDIKSAFSKYPYDKGDYTYISKNKRVKLDEDGNTVYYKKNKDGSWQVDEHASGSKDAMIQHRAKRNLFQRIGDGVSTITGHLGNIVKGIFKKEDGSDTFITKTFKKIAKFAVGAFGLLTAISGGVAISKWWKNEGKVGFLNWWHEGPSASIAKFLNKHWDSLGGFLTKLVEIGTTVYHAITGIPEYLSGLWSNVLRPFVTDKVIPFYRDGINWITNEGLPWVIEKAIPKIFNPEMWIKIGKAIFTGAGEVFNSFWNNKNNKTGRPDKDNAPKEESMSVSEYNAKYWTDVQDKGKDSAQQVLEEYQKRYTNANVAGKWTVGVMANDVMEQLNALRNGSVTTSSGNPYDGTYASSPTVYDDYNTGFNSSVSEIYDKDGVMYEGDESTSGPAMSASYNNYKGYGYYGYGQTDVYDDESKYIYDPTRSENGLYPTIPNTDYTTQQYSEEYNGTTANTNYQYNYTGTNSQYQYTGTNNTIGNVQMPEYITADYTSEPIVNYDQYTTTQPQMMYEGETATEKQFSPEMRSSIFTSNKVYQDPVSGLISTDISNESSKLGYNQYVYIYDPETMQPTGVSTLREAVDNNYIINTRTNDVGETEIITGDTIKTDNAWATYYGVGEENVRDVSAEPTNMRRLAGSTAKYVFNVGGRANKAGTILKVGGKVYDKVTRGTITGIAGKFINNKKVAKGIGTVAAASISGPLAVAGKVAGAAGKGTGIEKFARALSKLFSSGPVIGLIRKVNKNFNPTEDVLFASIKKLLTKFTTKIGSNVLGKLAGKVVSIVTSALFQIGVSAGLGFANANSVLGVTGSTSLLEKVFAGVINVLSEVVFGGLIPSETIVDLGLGLMGILGFSNNYIDQLRQRRTEAQNELYEYNAKNNTNYSLKDYNQVVKGGWFGKVQYHTRNVLNHPIKAIKNLFGFDKKSDDTNKAIQDLTDKKLENISLDNYTNSKIYGNTNYDINTDEAYYEDEELQENLDNTEGIMSNVETLTSASGINAAMNSNLDILGYITDQSKLTRQIKDENLEKAKKGNLPVTDGKYWNNSRLKNNTNDTIADTVAKMETSASKILYAPILSALNMSKDVLEYSTKIGTDVKTNLEQASKNTMSSYEASQQALQDLIPSGMGSKLNKYAGKASGFVSQVGQYANKKYGNSTIGESGCAPTTAMMALNNAKGNVMDIDEATSIADKGGYINSDGSTDIGYFKDVLERKGLNTNYYIGNNALDVQQDLAAGNNAILMGRDVTNRSKEKSPFGPGSHYVLAKGYDKKGNIIISDPENNEDKAYSSNILKNVNAAVGISGAGFKFGLTGKGKKINAFDVISRGNKYDPINSMTREQLEANEKYWDDLAKQEYTKYVNSTGENRKRHKELNTIFKTRKKLYTNRLHDLTVAGANKQSYVNEQKRITAEIAALEQGLEANNNDYSYFGGKEYYDEKLASLNKALTEITNEGKDFIDKNTDKLAKNENVTSAKTNKETQTRSGIRILKDIQEKTTPSNKKGSSNVVGPVAPNWTSSEYQEKAHNPEYVKIQNLGSFSPIETEDEITAFAKWFDARCQDKEMIGCSGYFLDASRQSGLDPRYIVAHWAVETGWGNPNKSHIWRDKFNGFGIGAFDNDPYNGSHRFNSRYDGIVSGATWIGDNYYRGRYGQTCLKKMRWNNNVHQYATATTWDTSIAEIMASPKLPLNKNISYDEGLINSVGLQVGSDVDPKDSEVSGGFFTKLTSIFGKIANAIFPGLMEDGIDGSTPTDQYTGTGEPAFINNSLLSPYFKQGVKNLNKMEGAKDIVTRARSYIGIIKYNYGSSDWDRKVMDCSAFTQGIYKQAKGVDIGINTMAQLGNAVNGNTLALVHSDQVMPGDLVYFCGTAVDGRGNDQPSHVGIISTSGNDPKVIHNGSDNGVVEQTLSSLNLPIIGYARIPDGEGYLTMSDTQIKAGDNVLATVSGKDNNMVVKDVKSGVELTANGSGIIHHNKKYSASGTSTAKVAGKTLRKNNKSIYSASGSNIIGTRSSKKNGVGGGLIGSIYRASAGYSGTINNEYIPKKFNTVEFKNGELSYINSKISRNTKNTTHDAISNRIINGTSIPKDFTTSDSYNDINNTEEFITLENGRVIRNPNLSSTTKNRAKQIIKNRNNNTSDVMYSKSSDNAKVMLAIVEALKAIENNTRIGTKLDKIAELIAKVVQLPASSNKSNNRNNDDLSVRMAGVETLLKAITNSSTTTNNELDESLSRVINELETIAAE